MKDRLAAGKGKTPASKLGPEQVDQKSVETWVGHFQPGEMGLLEVSIDKYSAFFLPSSPSLAISNREGIVYVPRSTVPLYSADSRSGMR